METVRLVIDSNCSICFENMINVLNTCKSQVTNIGCVVNLNKCFNKSSSIMILTLILIRFEWYFNCHSPWYLNLTQFFHKILFSNFGFCKERCILTLRRLFWCTVIVSRCVCYTLTGDKDLQFMASFLVVWYMLIQSHCLAPFIVKQQLQSLLFLNPSSQFLEWGLKWKIIK